MSRCEKVKVALRLRPSDSPSDQSIWSCSDSTVMLLDQYRSRLVEGKSLTQGATTSFQFGKDQADKCFGPGIATEPIYDTMVRNIVTGCRDGFSGSVLAYGQTGSGKSYLMTGDRGTDVSGIVHFALRDLLTQSQDGVLTCSLFELYNEQVLDLLAEEGKSGSLKVKEDPVSGFFVHNLREVECANFGDVEEVMDLGEQRRHYAATRLNHHSSRAHCLLRVTVRTTERSDGLLKVSNSTLHFVDLAGSERLSLFKDTTDDLTMESRHINRSLFYLCQVITRLSESSVHTHIPYRNSALTKILRSALGGTASTAIVCTAVPTLAHFEMTLSTLRFGAKARCIDNQVVADTYVETCESDSADSFGEVIERLKDDVRRVTLERDEAISRIPPVGRSLCAQSVGAVDIPPATVKPVKLTASTMANLEDPRIGAMQLTVAECQSRWESARRDADAAATRLQMTQISLKTVCKRYVCDMQRYTQAGLRKTGKKLRESNAKLRMILTGKGLETVQWTDLRKLEVILFHTIDRIKVSCRQDVRIRGERSCGETLESTSSSEGGSGRGSDCEGVEEEGK